MIVDTTPPERVSAMTTGEPVTIQPTWGGPTLKKNGRLGFEDGAITVTDRRGRTFRFPLSDRDGAPHRFLYGNWDGSADAAIVDRSGRSLVLIDLRAFKNADLDRWRDVIGLEGAEVPAPPPARPDAVALVDPPYVKIGVSAAGVGAVGFGVRSATGAEIFMWVLTVPGLMVAVICAVLGKMSLMSPAERASEAQAVVTKLKQLHSDNEAWLAEHQDLLTGPSAETSDDPAKRPEDPEPRPAPDGH